MRSVRTHATRLADVDNRGECDRILWTAGEKPADAATRLREEERRWTGQRGYRRGRRQGAGRTGVGAWDGSGGPRTSRGRRGRRRKSGSRTAGYLVPRGEQRRCAVPTPPARARWRGETPAPTCAVRPGRSQPSTAARTAARPVHSSRRRARGLPRRRVPARRAERRTWSGACPSTPAAGKVECGLPTPARTRVPPFCSDGARLRATLMASRYSLAVYDRLLRGGDHRSVASLRVGPGDLLTN
jgi:hypothetical protein